MKHVRKRDRKPMPSELYGRLSRATLWILVTFITLVSYASGVRPFISSSFGIYSSGLLDGILITVFGVAAIFYMRSKIGN